MSNKDYRLREFLSPADGRSLVVDTSAGLWLGALPGLDQFTAAISPILSLIDGLAASPGMARRLTGRTRAEAALLLRADWTNALRGSDFVLPPDTIQRVALLDPADALDLGASALVTSFLLGYEEQVEADCLRHTVQLALAGADAGLPVLVDVLPVGPRVRNFAKAVELGASYALEAGADGIILPYPGDASLRTIGRMAAGLPVWIKPSALNAASSEWEAALTAGVSGLWLGAEVFAAGNAVEHLSALGALLHPREVA